MGDIMDNIIVKTATLEDLADIQFLNNELFVLEKENYDIRIANTKLKEENEILKQKLEALLTFIQDHKEQ